MRVLLSAKHVAPVGGAERSLFELVQALGARGHELHLAYERAGSFLSAYEDVCRSTLKVQRLRTDRGRLTTFGAVARAALGAARAFPRPDVVHVNQILDLPYAATLAAVARAPLVCHLRDNPVTGDLPTGLALRRVTRSIAISRFIRDRYVEAGVPAESIDVVHTGIDPGVYRTPSPSARAAWRSEWGIADASPVILFAGRMRKDKGLEILLAAFARLREQHPRAVLVIAACAPDEPTSVQYPSSPGGLDGACRWLEVADVVPCYGAADVVVVPSVWDEPLSRVPLEAMACGCPVLASRVGGIPELFESGLEQLLVEPGSAEALRAALSRVLDWREHQPALGDRCRAHVRSRFSLEANVQRVEGVLREACTTHGRGSADGQHVAH